MFDLEQKPVNRCVVLLSDLHIDQMASEKMQLLVEFLREVPRDSALVILGDLADGLHRPEVRERLEETARPFLSMLARFRGPGEIHPLYVPGNHDRHFRAAPMDWGALSLHCVGKISPIYIEQHGRRIRLSHGDEYDPGVAFYRHTHEARDSGALSRIFGLERRLWMNLAARRRQRSELLDWLGAMAETPVPRPLFATAFWEFRAKRLLKKERVDAVVMGHTHAPRLARTDHGFYVNTGDWLQHAVVTWFDDEAIYQQDLSKERKLRLVRW